MRFMLIIFGLLLFCLSAFSQAKKTFTIQDSLRGGFGEGRMSWDLQHYELSVTPDFESKSIQGTNLISLKILTEGPVQIDLQQPMEIDQITLNGEPKEVSRNGNVFMIAHDLPPGTRARLLISFHGKPLIAKMPPWNGGWIFKKDKNGNPWMTVACQSLGASCWFPCKDSQQDEPDSGCVLNIETADSLVAVGPGRLVAKEKLAGNKMKFTWQVVNPINNYSIIPYIGKYIHFGEEYAGEKGRLDLDYWVLSYNEIKAKEHFKQVPGMIKAFEHWFGPYPFYDDSYKLVEAPFAGMEHQSSIAYGNQFKNGYTGDDLSGTGVGLKWDFMIVHESGHEWFGNSITAKDIADIWIHESFTSYSEVLYTEYHFGKEDASKYCTGYAKSSGNIFPCIGEYGVQDDPSKRSSDMYAKGSAMLHTIRQVMDNDSDFRQTLRDMNRIFYHQTVSSAEVEAFLCRHTGIDKTVFDQYLRNPKIPQLECRKNKKGKYLFYRWSNTIDGFKMNVRMEAGENSFWITPDKEWRKIKLSKKAVGKKVKPDPRFYINYKQL